MTLKKKMLISLAVVLGVMFVSSVSIMAATTSYGSREDPLITQSYLTKVYTKDVQDKISEAILEATDAVKNDINSVVAEYEGKIDAKIAPSVVTSTTDTFSAVTLNYGQHLQCDVGTELMLRVGGAVSRGGDYPALVDSTSGTSLSSGASISENHMYVVTIQGNGVTAMEDGTRILVRGNYQIS